MRLLLLGALAVAQTDADDSWRRQIMEALPFSVKAPKNWRANPESMERLLLRGEAVEDELAPYIVVERLDGPAEDYVKKHAAPKARGDLGLPVEEQKHRLGRAWRFKKTASEKYPKGAPDARTVPIVEEHYVLKAGKRSYLMALAATQADYRGARKDFERVIESFRVNDRIIDE